MLGEALELEFGVDLTIGPALEEGFYYDCFAGDRTFGDPERVAIEKRIEGAIKENQRFERVVVNRAEALSMFTENKFKVCVLRVLISCALLGRLGCWRAPPAAASIRQQSGSGGGARAQNKMPLRNNAPPPQHAPTQPLFNARPLLIRLRSSKVCPRTRSSRSTASAPWSTSAAARTCPRPAF